MICSKCYCWDVYWRNLGGFNQHTYCPRCGAINCILIEEEENND